MARYIDADVVMEVLERSAKDPRNETVMTSWSNSFQELIDLLDDTLIPMATTDVVEVVRCKDCKWQDKGENECESWNMCRHNVIEYFAIYDEHFCEWGERREDELHKRL